MNLSPSSQNRLATQIADLIRRTAINYGAVAAPVDQAGYPEAATVAIAETGNTDCTAKVAIYRNRLVYASATGTHVSYLTRPEDAGRIVHSLLSTEYN